MRPHDVLLKTILAIEHSRALVLRQADLNVVLVEMAHVMDSIRAEDALHTRHSSGVVEQAKPTSAAEMMNSGFVSLPRVWVLERLPWADCAVISIGSITTTITGRV
jgi:hypothetical protein